jgi:hypothetical protein
VDGDFNTTPISNITLPSHEPHSTLTPTSTLQSLMGQQKESSNADIEGGEKTLFVNASMVQVDEEGRIELLVPWVVTLDLENYK